MQSETLGQRPGSLLRWAAPALMLAGSALRIAFWLRRNSFWDDEIFVLLNIVRRGFSDLLRAPELQQTAPPGFLWAERLSFVLFGPGERSMHAFPLIMGLTSLPLAYLLGKRAFGRCGGLLTLALIAFSPVSILYSSDVKPYGSDLVVTQLLILCGLHFLGSSRVRSLDWWTTGVLALAGVVALWFSSASVFVLAGLGTLLLWRVLQQFGVSLAAAARILCVALTWGITLLGTVALRVSPDTMQYMKEYWRFTYLTAQPSLAAAANLFLIKGILGPLLSLEGGMPLVLVTAAFILLISGLCALVRSGRNDLLILSVVPIAAVLIVAIAGQWVVETRLMLFLAPIIALLIASGIEWFAAKISPRGKGRFAVTAAVAILLCSFPAKASIYRVRHPVFEQIAGSVRYALAQSKPGDTLYIYARGLAGWIYYTTDWRSPDREVLNWSWQRLVELGPNSGNLPSRGTPVSHEGEAWQRAWQGRTELIGVPEGIRRTNMPDPGAINTPNQPDPGWASNEWERCSGSAGRIVVVGISAGNRGLPDLLNEFQHRGARKLSEYAAETSRVVIFEPPR